MSGVKLTNECQNVYQAIQKDKKHRYAIFKIADGEICLDKVIPGVKSTPIHPGWPGSLQMRGPFFI